MDKYTERYKCDRKIILILSLFTCAIALYSQNVSNDFISITTNDTYHINKMYLDGNFSPIGWSNDGFFAYAEYAQETINNGVLIENKSAVYVMNTITDEIVEEISNFTEIMGNTITYADETLKDHEYQVRTEISFPTNCL